MCHLQFASHSSCVICKVKNQLCGNNHSCVFVSLIFTVFGANPCQVQVDNHIRIYVIEHIAHIAEIILLVVQCAGEKSTKFPMQWNIFDRSGVTLTPTTT